MATKYCEYLYPGHEATKVRRLDIGEGDGLGRRIMAPFRVGGGSGLFLCKKHWESEMRWRKGRNRKLGKRNAFSIRKWPG